MIERRRFPRYDCSFDVKYSTTGLAAIESVTTSKNISKAGIRISVSRMVKNGDMLNLYIDPADDKPPVRATGRVIWENNMTHSLLQRDAGVEFTHIDSSDAHRLIQSVSQNHH